MPPSRWHHSRLRCLNHRGLAALTAFMLLSDNDSPGISCDLFWAVLPPEFDLFLRSVVLLTLNVPFFLFPSFSKIVLGTACIFLFFSLPPQRPPLRSFLLYRTLMRSLSLPPSLSLPASERLCHQNQCDTTSSAILQGRMSCRHSQCCQAPTPTMLQFHPKQDKDEPSRLLTHGLPSSLSP